MPQSLGIQSAVATWTLSPGEQVSLPGDSVFLGTAVDRVCSEEDAWRRHGGEGGRKLDRGPGEGSDGWSLRRCLRPPRRTSARPGDSAGPPGPVACTHLSMFQGPSFIRAAGVLVTMSQDYVAAGVTLDMRAEDAGASSTGQQALRRFCPWTGQSRQQVSSLKPLREDTPLGAGPCHTRAQRDAHHGTATLSHLPVLPPSPEGPSMPPCLSQTSHVSWLQTQCVLKEVRGPSRPRGGQCLKTSSPAALQSTCGPPSFIASPSVDGNSGSVAMAAAEIKSAEAAVSP